MKPHQKIALIDMDGTVADFTGQLLKDLETIRSPGEPPLLSIEEMEQHPYLRARMSLVKSQPGWWRSLPRLERGFMIVRLLREFDFALHVATKGPHSKSQAWAEKVEWCRLWLPDASVHVVEEKSLLYGKVLVDDWPPYVQAWLNWRPRGLAIMPAYRYNEHMAEEFPRQVFLFRNEDDIPALRERIRELVEGFDGSEG